MPGLIVSATVLHCYGDVFDDWIVCLADVLEVNDPG